ncbi:unnamed protein product [Didymodactylos carnosus]|uniref:Uncharacterized protein n=1 Tax=Didymodactylos carnosus TaxID=1234261 RepID=A0A814EPW5_9BILA|nr:unnamed protein product [Didymodactylos carnosus]CAF0970283.1 unnamed protein product [Didymodactylos carnosus]CAF3551938.1 unnamed protein product [Didymodactylos carnosus]CAF3743397.1 unnamed protein product [Didymodactylos carnosus]
MVTVQTHFNRQWDWNHQNKIVSNEYEKGISRQYHAIEENEIKSLVSNRIKEHLGTKKYDANLGIDLSQAIAREIREELKMKYKNHKYIIQAVVGELNNM